MIIGTAVEFVSKKYNSQYYYSSLTNGYRKFDASRGMEYILDLKFQEVSTNLTVLKRYIVREHGYISSISIRNYYYNEIQHFSG